MTFRDDLYAYFYSQNTVNQPGRHADAVAAMVAERFGAEAEDAADWIRRLIDAWDCCGTCAGGVLAARDRRVREAAEREAERVKAAVLAIHHRETDRDVLIEVEGGRATVREDIEYCAACGSLEDPCPTISALGVEVRG